MYETKEICICNCQRCHESNHNSNSSSLSHNSNSRSVQRRSDDSDKALAAIGGAAVGIGLVFLLAAFSSK